MIPWRSSASVLLRFKRWYRLNVASGSTQLWPSSTFSTKSSLSSLDCDAEEKVDHERPKRKTIKLKPFPRKAIPSLAYLLQRRPDSPFHSGPFFNMILRPYPSGLGLMVPPWLPKPPRASTHEKRHLVDNPLAIVPFERRSASTHTVPDRTGPESDSCPERWERPERTSIKVNPYHDMRAIVFAGKKKVHKSAVVRNKCRTKLMAALEFAACSTQRGDPPRPPPAGIFVIHAKLEAYGAKMESLVKEMSVALARADRNTSRSHLQQSARPRRPRSTKTW
ncbi:hypothetical protein IE53DRAFT_76381 [Violaceomyces palustris]|uniref:Uncharacterized protein n=1 Tax=Violaceomyces palustris TaxID=1673888 RepID=A0ACD0P785_9BASI|nr:hypothetical protein IE53DRAFT_76381 [Violaceomyces palustris]